MPSLKDYTTKIKTLKNTEKMTRTMKMVSASKFRRALDAQVKARGYARALTHLTGRVASGLGGASHPLLTSRKITDNALILVMSSDRGLCGAFNQNINRRVLHWIAENRPRFNKISLSFAGRRGFMFFRRYASVEKHYEHLTDHPNFAKAVRVSDELIRLFLSGQYAEIYLAHNIYHSPMVQESMITKVLPLDSDVLSAGMEKGDIQPRLVLSGYKPQYIFEPSGHEILNELIPKFLHFQVYYALLENAVGEHGARMTAMDSASRNASELVEEYTLLRNRARQSSITKELIEIISGVEALK